MMAAGLLTTSTVMPTTTTLQRARRAARDGKSSSTQAGEFVREEIEHIREGKHGARSPEQAIAIGLSKARRAGVKLKPPREGTTTKKVRAQAERDYAKGQSAVRTPVSQKRSRASEEALQREGKKAASKSALSRHARKLAGKRA